MFNISYSIVIFAFLVSKQMNGNHFQITHDQITIIYKIFKQLLIEFHVYIAPHLLRVVVLQSQAQQVLEVSLALLELIAMK